MHREEKQPRRRLADVVDVEVLWRRQRHNKLKERGNTSAIMKKPVTPEHQRCRALAGIKISATLNGIWISESNDPSSSTTGPDWSPDISCMVASNDSPAELSAGCKALARVSKALAGRGTGYTSVLSEMFLKIKHKHTHTGTAATDAAFLRGC